MFSPIFGGENIIFDTNQEFNPVSRPCIAPRTVLVYGDVADACSIPLRPFAICRMVTFKTYR